MFKFLVERVQNNEELSRLINFPGVYNVSFCLDFGEINLYADYSKDLEEIVKFCGFILEERFEKEREFDKVIKIFYTFKKDYGDYLVRIILIK
jgi:hypothetical protein